MTRKIASSALALTGLAIFPRVFGHGFGWHKTPDAGTKQVVS